MKSVPWAPHGPEASVQIAGGQGGALTSGIPEAER